ncbi:MAG: transcriptional regulator, AraC family [Firmicutes bacterium]|nr:transcriptional regulator, AraC family [Bacillota bacterium]
MSKEKVDFWVMPQLNNLELLHATYVNHTFTKHIHDGFALGVIEQGALRFSYKGETLTASPGCINLVIPGEAHDGFAASDEGWTYRMFYLESKLLEQVVYDMSGKIHKIPYFKAGVIQDTYLANVIRNLHLFLEDASVSLVEQESLLLAMLTEFISRYAEERYCIKSVGQETMGVNLTREYIEDNYTKNLSIKELSAVCHLSPYHLIRVFHKCIGVPPHIYLKQVRIKRAKELLAKGFSMAFIANEVGFVDQSHFTKQFKQITGITPKKYSNIIQEIFTEKVKMK